MNMVIFARRLSLPLRGHSHVVVNQILLFFWDVDRSDHPAIIKVISEDTDLPHVIYISREKNPKYHHRHNAGAMNVLARVSGVMTNSPLMLNVDCDMYANNPQAFLHAMCMLLDYKNDQDCGFIQFPQTFYDSLKDDPFGNQLHNYYVGWLYGSASEDILTAIDIHGRGWRSAYCSPDPHAFLGCVPSTYPSAMIQQKRWSSGLFETLIFSKNPLILALEGNLWFRQALAYYWLCLWAVRSIVELFYAFLPAYCIITGSHFLPKVNERAFVIPMGLFVIYNIYALWEFKRLGASLRMRWNLQRMGRVTPITAWLFGFLSVIAKLVGLSKTVFEVTQKENKSSDSDGDTDSDDKNVARFTYDKSPIIIPGVVVLLVNMTTVVNVVIRLLIVGCIEIWMHVLGFGVGEMFCSIWVILCEVDIREKSRTMKRKSFISNY